MLDTYFLEQCRIHNRHPINIYRMNSPSPDLPSISVEDQVFSRHLPFPKGPQVNTISIRLCSFLAAVPEGDMLHGNKSACTASPGTAPTGAWLALLMRIFFFFGLQWRGQVSAKHAHIPLESPRLAPLISRLLTGRGHSAVKPWEDVWVTRDQPSLQRLFLKMFSLCELIWECWWRKSSRLSQMVSVESKHTTSRPPALLPAPPCQSWSRERAKVLFSSSTWNVPCLAPNAWAPVTSKTQSSMNQFICFPHPLAEIQLQM